MSGRLAFQGESTERKLPAGGRTSWKIQLMPSENRKKKVKIKIEVALQGEVEEAPEWGVTLSDARSVLWESAAQLPPEVEITLEGGKAKELTLDLEAPKGGRFGDQVKVALQASDTDSPTEVAWIEFSAAARQSILALKTSIGHERNVADSVASKAKSGKTGIFAILAPTSLRGYVLIEGMNTDLLRENVRGIRRTRGLVDGETSFDEIDHFLTPKPLVSGIMEGDVIELIAGPFKGEKARVQKIDESKEEITVELFEAMVPIPVTVRGDHVRVLEKDR
ncbi:MAG: transcription elongation factor Spt5 [Methanomassiliicoccales archaeon]